MLARTLIGSVKKQYGFAFDTIIEKYKDLNPEVHLPDERGYEFLNDGDYFVTICGENNLSIQFSDCITVFFGGWYNRFIDAADAIKVIDDILSRTLCVYVLVFGDNRKTIIRENTEYHNADMVKLFNLSRTESRAVKRKNTLVKKVLWNNLSIAK